jgi:preprotein translocase subunit SecA
MLTELKERVTTLLARVELAPDRPVTPEPVSVQMVESHAEPISALTGEPLDNGGQGAAVASMVRTPAVDPNDQSTWAATPRNASCPCGSGKKYKHCHGRLA